MSLWSLCLSESNKQGLIACQSGRVDTWGPSKWHYKWHIVTRNVRWIRWIIFFPVLPVLPILRPSDNFRTCSTMTWRSRVARFILENMSWQMLATSNWLIIQSFGSMPARPSDSDRRIVVFTVLVVSIGVYWLIWIVNYSKLTTYCNKKNHHFGLFRTILDIRNPGSNIASPHCWKLISLDHVIVTCWSLWDHHWTGPEAAAMLGCRVRKGDSWKEIVFKPWHWLFWTVYFGRFSQVVDTFDAFDGFASLS